MKVFLPIDISKSEQDKQQSELMGLLLRILNRPNLNNTGKCKRVYKHLQDVTYLWILYNPPETLWFTRPLEQRINSLSDVSDTHHKVPVLFMRGERYTLCQESLFKADLLNV